MPQIKGFIESSFIDWKGRVCAVLFFGGCNFRCPFCHNHPLVTAPDSIATLDYSEIKKRLDPRKKWLEGICVSGGEPTLDPGLPEMLETLKKEGWRLKLDTNGSKPEVLQGLLEKRLLDMISMDVKAPLDQAKYNRCAGVKVDLALISKSISLIKESGTRHEFRMTVVPGFHSWEDVIEWASLFSGNAILTLQNFNPKTTLDPGMEHNKAFQQDQFDELKRALTTEFEKMKGVCRA